MSNILRVEWTITPQVAPRPWLNCNRCGVARPYVSSGKFRMNANGRRLDAWLVYNCVVCDNSWNRPVIERRQVGELDPSLLRALQANDPLWVDRIAFDVEGLKRHTGRIEETAEVAVGKTRLSAGEAPFARFEIDLIVKTPAALRLDRLLASELAVSRAQIQAWSADGRLALFPHGERMLRRPVRDGTRVCLEGCVGAEIEGL